MLVLIILYIVLGVMLVLSSFLVKRHVFAYKMISPRSVMIFWMVILSIIFLYVSAGILLFL
jgi:hypothetical protein